jgi:hypothetical protein
MPRPITFWFLVVIAICVASGSGVAQEHQTMETCKAALQLAEITAEAKGFLADKVAVFGDTYPIRLYIQ